MVSVAEPAGQWVHDVWAEKAPYVPEPQGTHAVLASLSASTVPTPQSVHDVAPGGE
jgi:hypothetical protein